jgi:hypothetical protein
MFKCDNCGQSYEREEQLKYVFPDIPDLLHRLDVGGLVPAGECSECNALVYSEGVPMRVLIVLEGGLVQDVLVDKPDVEVAVLNMDTEGVDDDEIVQVTGENETLEGTLQFHVINIAPETIESAWRPVEAV